MPHTSGELNMSKLTRTWIAAVLVVAAAGFIGWLAGTGRLTPAASAQYNPVVRVSAEVPAAGAANKFDRTVLPIPEPNYPHSTVLDARDAKAPPRFHVTA